MVPTPGRAGAYTRLDSLDDFCEDPADVENGLSISVATLRRAERTGHITVAKFDVLRKKLDETTCDDLLEKLAPPKPEEKRPGRAGSDITAKIHLAQDQARDDQGKKAIATLEAALRSAQSDGTTEDEVEVLVALCILSSDRRGIWDRRRYFAELERKQDKIEDSTLKVLYHRSRAAVLGDAGDRKGAEEALRAALKVCAEATDDPKQALAIQG